MPKLALLLGIALTTMPFFAGHVRADDPCINNVCQVSAAGAQVVVQYDLGGTPCTGPLSGRYIMCV